MEMTGVSGVISPLNTDRNTLINIQHSSIKMLISGPAASQTPLLAHQNAVIKFHEGARRG